MGEIPLAFFQKNVDASDVDLENIKNPDTSKFIYFKKNVYIFLTFCNIFYNFSMMILMKQISAFNRVPHAWIEIYLFISHNNGTKI